MTASTKIKGKEGEQIALLYLQKKGYEILQQNYRFQRAEIDIVAQYKQRLIFIEVKSHENKGFGMPETAVSAKQEARIMKAADEYIWQNNWQGDIRFDIVAILMQKGEVKEITHFEDAFY